MENMVFGSLGSYVDSNGAQQYDDVRIVSDNKQTEKIVSAEIELKREHVDIEEEMLQTEQEGEEQEEEQPSSEDKEESPGTKKLNGERR